MSPKLRRICGLSLSASLLAAYLPPLPAAPPAKITPQVTLAQRGSNPRLLPREGTLRWSGGFLQAAFQEPDQAPMPDQPLVPPPQQPLIPSPEQPTVPAPDQPTVDRPGAVDSEAVVQNLDPDQLSNLLREATSVASVPGGATTGGEAQAQGAADLGQLLAQSANVDTVEVQRRSPVAMDPNIRGYKQGQIYTQGEGAYWLPARQDLDTMLSKIDPTMIDNVVVLSGPYGVQYGPGLAFVAIDMADTPRYECGPEHHARILGATRTNGGQLYGRATAYGGDDVQGYRISYGDKKGSDYLSGNDTQIPSSYDANDVWAQWGYSINPDQRIELSYLRYEQIDTEYPGQFFNIDDLVTDGFNVRLLDVSPQGPWTELRIDAWWNRTRFNGDNLAKRNPLFPEVQRAEFAFEEFNFRQQGIPVFGVTQITAFTAGDLESTGARGMTTWGDRDDRHLITGADFRFLDQNITEDIFIDTPALGLNQVIFTNMPRATATDPGLFAEYVAPVNSYWTAKLGSRVDFYSTDASEAELRSNSFLVGSEFEQHDTLYAFYWTNEVLLDCNWTLTGGFGHGQRSPTLIERYADGLFLGIAQSGFTRVIGDPQLDQERAWQADIGLQADYDYWRARGAVFYAWIDDYITLDGNIVEQPPFLSARLFRFANTDEATLAGFEMGGEYDWSDYLSPFATMRYVEGRDQIIDAPLPQIPPLDTVIGVRLHEPSQARLWSVEFAARIVDNQDRLGTVRSGAGTEVIEEETPGFTVWHLRSYYNYSSNLTFTAGVENLFDRNYQEHLDLRLRGPTGFPGGITRALAPGITPYFGIDWTF
jgi:outer membrane receptor protein involved in Fe transport